MNIGKSRRLRWLRPRPRGPEIGSWVCDLRYCVISTEADFRFHRSDGSRSITPVITAKSSISPLPLPLPLPRFCLASVSLCCASALRCFGFGLGFLLLPLLLPGAASNSRDQGHPEGGAHGRAPGPASY
ncbi:hypothetical protein [Lysobacter gummosus]|uniref:hypothetical protein n=1 Tax=Lysobacter gummosus TaxID=262324 RepID=UPI0036270BDC